VPASQRLLFPDPRPLVERLGLDFFRQLPGSSGVYLMRDAAEGVLYVGKAKNLRQRLGHYRVANPERMGRRHLRLLRQVVRIELEVCADESAALAREAELLRTLKPRFNRAGVWPGSPRYLVWRFVDGSTEWAIAKSPPSGWWEFGPFGSGVRHLRGALVRLLWYALNPTAGSSGMPAGWLHGRFGAVASLAAAERDVGPVLTPLFAGDGNGFVTWIGERTAALTRGYDRDLRDADLETVTRFVQTKARRAIVYPELDTGAEKESGPAEPRLPFAETAWEQP
jgi:predicted GIY-YIG superfamily endonuclease